MERTSQQTDINLLSTNDKLLAFAEHQKKNGLAPTTIEARTRKLQMLAELTNLDDPEAVKATITDMDGWKESTKLTFIDVYQAYLVYQDVQWKRPHLKPERKIPFIPTETEIDQLIASCGKRTATLLQTLKETGARISEAVKIKWIDFDTQRRTLNITPSKGSNPRLVPISEKLTAMLCQMPKTRETIFAPNTGTHRDHFGDQRRTASEKLQNPRILQISFHTFRHFKGTMEYHVSKDVMHVKYVLGHKNINNTMIYINIEQATFLSTSNDEWTCKTAKDANEASQLIEVGFEYVQTINELHLYKKRK